MLLSLYACERICIRIGKVFSLPMSVYLGVSKILPKNSGNLAQSVYLVFSVSHKIFHISLNHFLSIFFSLKKQSCVLSSLNIWTAHTQTLVWVYYLWVCVFKRNTLYMCVCVCLKVIGGVIWKIHSIWSIRQNFHSIFWAAT